VVSTLRNLARDGRTVIASIHQPSSEVFELFDNLTLLSGGRLVYFGEAKAAREVSISIAMAWHGFIISVVCDDGKMFSLMSTFQPSSPTMPTLVISIYKNFDWIGMWWVFPALCSIWVPMSRSPQSIRSLSACHQC
jgi:hypothetical protein